MKRFAPIFAASLLLTACCCLHLYAQTGAYTPPEPDTVKVRFVSKPSAEIVWAPKPKPDWAKYTETQPTGGQPAVANAPTAGAPEADWKKYMPKDPVCETTKGKDGEKIDVWTVEGWTPIEFHFTAPAGEFPAETKFTIFPNKKEVHLESSGSIGSAWTLKDSDGVTPVEKPVVEKKKEKKKKHDKDKKADDTAEAEPENDEMLVGKPQVVSWLLAEMSKPTATANFVFNYRGKDMTTVTVTISKKPEKK